VKVCFSLIGRRLDQTVDAQAAREPAWAKPVREAVRPLIPVAGVNLLGLVVWLTQVVPWPRP